MKKLLLSIFVASSFAANAQVTVYEDSFEGYEDFVINSFGEWLTLDLDMLSTYTGGTDTPAWPNAGDPMAFQIFNPTTALVTNETDASTGEVRNFDPHTGSKYAASWAGVPESNGQTATANNDWLISPIINLGPSNNVVSFWVKSMSETYGLEQYRVGVYTVTGDGIPTSGTDFAVISGIPVLTAPFPNWEEKTFTLAASYANTQVRIGIRYVSADRYMFMVDDFKVTSASLSVNEALAGKFSAYPNPSNGIINLTNAESIRVSNVQITDLNGRVVKTVSYSDAPSAVEINISDLSSGMYMMNITSDEGVAVKKIMKN